MQQAMKTISAEGFCDIEYSNTNIATFFSKIIYSIIENLNSIATTTVDNKTNNCQTSSYTSNFYHGSKNNSKTLSVVSVFRFNFLCK